MTDISSSERGDLAKSALGDRIRSIAGQLRQESQVQIRATSRILGAAAKLAVNQDHLIDEVVEMVEADLNQEAHASQIATVYTVKHLKQQFGKLNEAKAYFGFKASSWSALADKLNETHSTPDSSYPSERTDQTHADIPQRLTAIEQELQVIRKDINQALKLLDRLVAELLTPQQD